MPAQPTAPKLLPAFSLVLGIALSTIAVLASLAMYTFALIFVGAFTGM